MRSIIKIIALSTFLYCCTGTEGSQKESKEYQEKFTLKLVGTKTFLLNSTTSSDNSSSHYYQDQESRNEYLFLLNRKTLELQLFDWRTSKNILNINLERDGPNGVGRAYMTMVKTLDSIFILDPIQFKVSIVNSKGKVIKRYSLNENATKPRIGSGAMPDAQVPMVTDGNKLFIGSSPFSDLRERQYYENGKIGLELDLETGGLKDLISFPKSFAHRYQEGKAITSQQAHFAQTFNFSKEHAVFNFMTEDSIYVLNLASKVVTPYYAGSKFFDEIEYSKISVLSDIDKEFDFFAEQPNYNNLQFYPSKKLYLRYGAVPNTARIKKWDPMATEPLFHYSAIILDDNFKKVGEVKLSDDHWNVVHSLVTPDGIYIKTVSDEENKLSYKRYVIETVSSEI